MRKRDTSIIIDSHIMHVERRTHNKALKGDIFIMVFAEEIKQGETKLS
jgi:hypothetical protein